MACNEYESSVFAQKLGRCKSCMWQLSLLSALSWPLWWGLYWDTPYRVESIALVFFCISFTGLLLAHLVVFGYRSLTHRS
ncbi:DUF3624 domain-containing protein [Shewanella violacea]|uniref:DUF3624 domain-containing protein n=1 Tax=Shewanella violacea (strain JCM 10179 / CIP 106290 / LMG 19151 / DSS12) TaxID=637905 RepID=D4ZAP4_SHEVD|nr:DUF3624 domain-containing protein [Shewanella violacea]BAJ03089.1 conserved hypothetical protein [Shewanella violacea DSS12]